MAAPSDDTPQRIDAMIEQRRAYFERLQELLDRPVLNDAHSRYMEERRKTDPLIDDVLANTDWHDHIYERGHKPWIDCRDSNGNLYNGSDGQRRVHADKFCVLRNVQGPRRS